LIFTLVLLSSVVTALAETERRKFEWYRLPSETLINGVILIDRYAIEILGDQRKYWVLTSDRIGNPEEKYGLIYYMQTDCQTLSLKILRSLTFKARYGRDTLMLEKPEFAQTTPILSENGNTIATVACSL
jgi:hypothetical protein